MLTSALDLVRWTYVFRINGQRNVDLISNLFDNSQDSLLCSGNSILASSNSDRSLAIIAVSLVDIDLSTSLVLDPVDGGTGFTNNLGDALGGNGKLEFLPRLVLECSSFEQLSLGLSDTLLATSDSDFVGLGGGRSILVVSGEGELDAVLLFESDSVFTSGTNECRLNSSLDGDAFGSLVFKLLDLSFKSSLGLVNSLLSTDNLYVSTNSSFA